jgi:hypothetical protein
MIKLIVDLHPIVKNRTAVESLSTLYIPMKAHTLMQAIPRASADSDANHFTYSTLGEPAGATHNPGKSVSGE